MTTEEQIYQNEYRKVEDHVKEVIRTTNINYSPYYHVLPELINQRGYQYGIELGIFAAGNILSILQKTNAKLVIGVDPYKEYAPGELGMGTIVSQLEFDIMCKLAVESLPKDRFELLRMTSDEAYQYLIDQDRYIDELYFQVMGKSFDSKNKFDWVFVDAAHTYENCKRDLNNYSQLIRKGGVICCHDWQHGSFPGVTQAIKEFAEEHHAEIIPREFYFAYMEKTWD
jgi:SAM-dependent methyltransferase